MVNVGPLLDPDMEPDPRLVGIVCCSGCRDCRRAKAEHAAEVERYESCLSLTKPDLDWLAHHEALARQP
jgi:hypothetical protein